MKYTKENLIAAIRETREEPERFEHIASHLNLPTLLRHAGHRCFMYPGKYSVETIEIVRQGLQDLIGVGYFRFEDEEQGTFLDSTPTLY